MLSATLKCARSCAVISMSCLVKQRLSYATHIRSFPAPPNNDRDEELKEGDCAQPQQQAPPPSAPPFVSDDLSSRDAMHDASQVPPAARGKDDYTQVLQRAYALGAAAAAAGKPLPFGEAGAASDVAPLLGARRVEIIACGRSHMRAAPQWQIRFNPLEKWTNGLTGWTSTGDPMESCPEATLWFYTREQAKRFCARQGWHATVVAEPRPSGRRLARFAGYGDNFTVKRGGVPDLSHLPSRRGGGSGGSGSGSSAADGTADGAPRG